MALISVSTFLGKTRPAAEPFVATGLHVRPAAQPQGVSPNPKILSAFAISGMKEKGPLV